MISAFRKLVTGLSRRDRARTLALLGSTVPAFAVTNHIHQLCQSTLGTVLLATTILLIAIVVLPQLLLLVSSRRNKAGKTRTKAPNKSANNSRGSALIVTSSVIAIILLGASAFVAIANVLPTTTIPLRTVISSKQWTPIDDALSDYEKTRIRPLLSKTVIDVQTEYKKRSDAYSLFSDPAERASVAIMMVDDPWIPEFEAYLEDLTPYIPPTINIDSLYPANVLEVCRRSGKLLGLPLVGNSQVLLFRKDVWPSMTALLPADEINGVINEVILDQMKAEVLTPHPQVDSAFLARYENDNELTESFWQVLRGYGYSEVVSNSGAVVLRKDQAQKALDWIKAMEARQHEAEGDQLTLQLMTGSVRSSMMFSWPSWMAKFYLDRKWPANVSVHRFLREPIMGVWFLTVPKRSSEADKARTEYAASVVIDICTSQEIQKSLAQRGNVPVFKSGQFRYEDYLKDNYEFWKVNYEKFIAFLSVAKPRPRTVKWSSVEAELAKQIKRGALAEVPELIEFL